MSPEEMQKAYLDAMGSASTSEKYKKGIANVKVNPMEAAARAEDKYLRAVEASVRSGRRRERLLAVPFAQWRDNATKHGAERLRSGAQKAAEKMLSHFRKFGSVYESISAHVATMPNDTEEDALERVRYSMRKLKEAAGKL